MPTQKPPTGPKPPSNLQSFVHVHWATPVGRELAADPTIVCVCVCEVCVLLTLLSRVKFTPLCRVTSFTVSPREILEAERSALNTCWRLTKIIFLKGDVCPGGPCETRHTPTASWTHTRSETTGVRTALHMTHFMLHSIDRDTCLTPDVGLFWNE